MKQFNTLSIRAFAVVACSLGLFWSAHGQTTLINENFEGAATWSFANTVATNVWVVGTATNNGGANAAYITNNAGVSNAYTLTTTSANHVYWAVSVPAGETAVVLGFDWRAMAEFDATTLNWDYMRVSVTSAPPVAGALPAAADQIPIMFAGQDNYTRAWVDLPAAMAGAGTRYLVFTWHNDGSLGNQTPSAIDNVSLVSRAPAGGLSGTHTIPGSFSSIGEAIANVNARGANTGGGSLIFDVAAGSVFTETPCALTASGSSATNRIIFQKSGGGANPVVIAEGSGNHGVPGVVVGGSIASLSDGIITMNNVDFVTFNGIDVTSNNSLVANPFMAIEHGYIIRNTNILANVSTVDGANSNIIEGCKVTLNRARTNGSIMVGIVVSSLTGFGGSTTATLAAHTNNNNIVRDITVYNAGFGVAFQAGATALALLDVGNQVTTTLCTSFNVIGDPLTANDLGANGATNGLGVSMSNQSGCVVKNCSVRNVATTTQGANGISVSGMAGICEISNNKVRGIRRTGTGTTTAHAGIQLAHSTIAGATGTFRVFNNSISDITSAYTGAATVTRGPRGINVSGTGGSTLQTYEIYDNAVSINNSSNLNISTACLEFATSSGPIYLVRNNIFSNYTAAQGATAKHFGIVHTSATAIGNTGSAVSNNDIYIANDLSVSGHPGRGNLTNYNSVALWQGSVPQATANLAHDPVFVDATTDLHSGAVLNNAAGFAPPAYITVDLDCATRTPDNDIGAYIINVCSGTPTAGSITGANAVCAGTGTTLTLTGATTGGGISYQWFSGPVGGPWLTPMGNSTTQATGNLVTATGYVVTVTCSFGGSSTTAEKVVAVNALPTVTITPAPANAVSCGGGGVTLTAGGAVTYAWSPTSGLAPTSGSPVVATPVASTIYTVTGTDANGCIDTETQTVIAAPAVTMGATSATPSTVCYNGTSSLATSAATTGYYVTFGGSSFTDISGTGTSVGVIADDSEHAIIIPSFTFNGTAYTNAVVGNNGALLFTTLASDVNYTNGALPAAIGAELTGALGTLANVGVCPFWDDLTPGAGGSVVYQTIGNLFIVQWTNEDHFSAAGAGTVTFQLQLNTVSGEIHFAYSDVVFSGSSAQDNGGSATVGLNFSGSAAVQYSFNTANLSNGLVLTFTPSSIASFSWSPVTFLNNAALQNPTASSVTATTAYTATATANSGCTATGNATVTMTPCVYYSRATGNVSDPIWSPVPTGLPGAGAATFTSATDMVVQSPDVVTNTSANVQVDELTVDVNGTLMLNATTVLNTNGNVVVNGTLTANDNSSMVMSSAVAQTATFAATTSFWDLAVDATVSCTVTGNIEMRGTLDLQDGVFDCTGNQVALTSSATQTGRLGPVAPSASYTGNLRIDRYRLAGSTNWLLLGSPINSRAVQHWQDDFITAGYPGSQFPNFDDPVGSNILWPSVRWYDETNTGTGVNDGLQGVSSWTHALSTGQGFAVWAGTGLINTTAFTIDLGSNTPVIAQTPVSLPVSWTDTSTPAADGWNLVSNPLPSPIAFDQIVRGADVSDFVTFYNPDNGNTAVWDISLNSGTNSATNTIQSMQGFFLKASGSGVATTVSEGAKVNDNGGGMFGFTGELAAHLRLRIASGLNTFSDEAIMVFSEGQPGADGGDAQKFVLAHNAAPQIATLSDGIQMVINAYGNADAGVSMPLQVNVGVTGEHTINAVEVGGLELSCLAIEDLATGTMVSLLDGPGYTFNMDSEADPTVPRFVLHINNGPDAAFTADNSTVTVGQSVQFTSTQAANSYTWDFGDGNVSSEANPMHAWDAAGTYTVTLNVSDGLCGDLATTDITVELSTGMNAAASTEHMAWATPQGIAVAHAFSGTQPVTLELLDATGRLVMSRRMTSTRTVLPSNDLAEGIWFVRLDNGTGRVTLRVPLAR